MSGSRIIICKKCGKEIEVGVKAGRQKYCKECAAKVREQKRKQYKEYNPEKRNYMKKINKRNKVAKRNNKKIDNIQQAADALGMSYGMYVATYKI